MAIIDAAMLACMQVHVLQHLHMQAMQAPALQATCCSLANMQHTASPAAHASEQMECYVSVCMHVQKYARNLKRGLLDDQTIMLWDTRHAFNHSMLPWQFGMLCPILYSQ
jgi:hypothetical protein